MFIVLFIAGVLTILLPCILPLLPIVLGVSIAGRSPWRPLLTVLGMVVSFVGFTFFLHVVLSQFVEVADYLRIGTYQILLLFGLGFALHRRDAQLLFAALSGLFFWSKGIPSVLVAVVIGILAMELGGRVAGLIQQLGANIQGKVRGELGVDTPATAFFVGLTMGLVWVPCAGPALGFALALIREQPGLQAFLLLSAYALGTAFPLLLVGYGGQWVARRVRFLAQYSGKIKQAAGWILMLTAFALQFQWLRALETWLVQNTSYGTLGTQLEEQLFPTIPHPGPLSVGEGKPILSPVLPRVSRAPEFAGLGPWHNSAPLTLKELRGKVVLVDFWTYSCINCIRTLPHIQEYWEKFKDKPFMLIGVHSPEFVFEKSEKNVADAIQRHRLTYPVAQDNDFGTWRVFSNHYWPAKYLVDAEGYIRYSHFGEGGYEETEEAIRSLLEEIGVGVEGTTGVTLSSSKGDTGRYRELTPETYLGARSWPALLNGPRIPSDEVIPYKVPEGIFLHRYALIGDWQLVDDERQVLRSSEGEIRMKFLAGEINLVLGLENGASPVAADVWVDGKKIQSFTVDHDDLYSLWKGEHGEHELVLKFKGAGVSGYAFTFGS